MCIQFYLCIYQPIYKYIDYYVFKCILIKNIMMERKYSYCVVKCLTVTRQLIFSALYKYLPDQSCILVDRNG